MAFINQVTNLDTYKRYLQTIGIAPNSKLERCFSCGLPAVWLYMKAIGLEDKYFDLLAKCEKRSLLVKELFYLLILSNGQNKFFPHLPSNFLKLEIPRDVAVAQVKIAKPAFETAYGFTPEQLKETLELIAKPNVMIRVGNQRKAIGIMYKDNVYHVYHRDNPRALEFKSLDGCVDLIIRVINEQSKGITPLVIQAGYLEGIKARPLPNPARLIQKFLKRDGVPIISRIANKVRPFNRPRKS